MAAFSALRVIDNTCDGIPEEIAGGETVQCVRRGDETPFGGVGIDRG